jgi:hypothetical protein
VRLLIRYIPFCIITVFYVCSLLPATGGLQDNSTEGNLRQVILALQSIHPEDPATATEFHKAFSNTIKTINAIAGLQPIILKRLNGEKDTSPLFLVVSFRLPHLLGSETDLSPPSITPFNRHFDITTCYDSIIITPTPPPPLSA